MTNTLENPHEQLTVTAWRDPVVERVGHDACGDYVEAFWISTLGPTATWLLRRLAVVVSHSPDGFVVDLGELATAVGLGSDASRTSTLRKAMHRLVLFGLAHHTGDGLAIRTVVPPLSMKQLSRLPQHLQKAHALWSDPPVDHAIDAVYSFGTTDSERTMATSSAY